MLILNYKHVRTAGFRVLSCAVIIPLWRTPPPPPHTPQAGPEICSGDTGTVALCAPYTLIFHSCWKFNRSVGSLFFCSLCSRLVPSALTLGQSCGLCFSLQLLGRNGGCHCGHRWGPAGTDQCCSPRSSCCPWPTPLMDAPVTHITVNTVKPPVLKVFIGSVYHYCGGPYLVV